MLRFYKVQGRLLPSVTTVLSYCLRKPGLERWRGEVGNAEADRRLETTARRGIEVHGAIEGFNLSRWAAARMGRPPGEVPGVPVGYQSWFEEVMRRVLLVEQVVYSLDYGYAGRVDLVGELKTGAVVVVDFKSVSGLGWLRPEWLLQTAAYAEALRRRGIPVEGRYVILVERETLEVRPVELGFHGEDFGAFLFVLHYFNWLLRRFPERLEYEGFEIVEVGDAG